MIYLDNNATTRLSPAVAQAMFASALEQYGNPASTHRAGRRARRALEGARETIGRRLGARLDAIDSQCDRVILTSGATEANNLALTGLTRLAMSEGRSGQVVVSAIEHPSVLALTSFPGAFRTATHRETSPPAVARAPVNRDGVVDLDALRELLLRPTLLVSLMLVNHETGVAQPVAEAAELAHAAGAWLHVDAVQGAGGKWDVDFQRSGADAWTATAHKVHGPVGIGALLVRAGLAPPPLLQGGAQQMGLRPGTESVPLAVGFAAALEQTQQDADRGPRLRRQREWFERTLLERIPDIVIHGRAAPRATHTVNIGFPGVDRQTLLLALDARGVACSSGAACASGSSEPSPVLRAMGLPEPLVESSLRFSLGADTTDEELDRAVAVLEDCVSRLRCAARP